MTVRLELELVWDWDWEWELKWVLDGKTESGKRAMGLDCGIEAGQDVSQARQLHMQIAGHKPQNWSLAAN